MNERDHEHLVLVSLALLLILLGAAVGVWNEWSTQACIEQERPPGTHVDCEDSMTSILRYGSIGTVLAGVGLLITVSRGG